MQSQIQQRLRLLKRIENLSAPATSRIARHVVAAGIHAVKHGGYHIDRRAIAADLGHIMGIAYVRRYELEERQLALNLSYETDTARIAQKLHLELGDLGSSFTRNVRPHVNEAATYWEDRINAALGRISSQQLPTRRATIAMRQELSDMGLSPNNPSLPETLVRTHLQMSFGAAQWNLDREQDKYGLIESYTYSTVGDDRVDDECSALEGFTAAVNDPIWQSIWPPNHFNCRCQCLSNTETVPLSDPLSPDTIRDATDDGRFAFNPADLLDD